MSLSDPPHGHAGPQPRSKPAPALHIAIVGAGVAGLACARRLTGAGAAVTVFEKSRGPGGRCATRRSEVGLFHHGVPCFSARSAAFGAEVARWHAAGWVRPGAAPGSWVGWPTMNALVRQLAAGLPVLTEATATEIMPDGAATGHEPAAWRVRCAEATTPPAAAFDAVVVAVPAEQAHALTRSSALLQAQLQAVHSDPCWTLMLAWPSGAAPASLPDLSRLSHLSEGSPLAAVVDCSALPPSAAEATPDATAGAPPAGVRWALHARADWSRRHIEDTAAQATEALLQALSATFPDAQPLPPPTHAVAHRWRYAQVMAPAAAPFGWDAALRLGCCGDAWQGSETAAGALPPDGIERAWLSGVGVADAVLRALTAAAASAR